MRFIFAFVFVLLLLMALGGCHVAEEPAAAQTTTTNDGWGDNGITIVTDPETKCQYVRSYAYSLTPRLDQNGNPICGGV